MHAFYTLSLLLSIIPLSSEIHSSSPFLQLSRQEWQRYRQDTPMTLTQEDLEKLHGQIERVSLNEIEEIYLPLSRLLNLYITGRQELHTFTSKFLGHPEPKVPFVIAISGSVSVGKSTTSRILQALLSRWPSHPIVDIVTTDGFLYSKRELEEKGLMERKGFPESYDQERLLQFLYDLKSGKETLKIPIYSHQKYDIEEGVFQTIEKPDIVILEGVNVLQVGSRLSISDFSDFSIYVDAEEKVIKGWYLERFMLFRERANKDPNDFYHRFSQMGDQEALTIATRVWNQINALNLEENILPYRERAHLILEKRKDHSVTKISLRKL